MRQFTTLVYDRWRCTRRLFFIAIGVGIASSLGSYLELLRSEVRRGTEFDELLFFALGGLHLTHFLWLMFLLVATGEDDDLKLTTPRYLMRLPVSAWKLVAAQLSYGIGSSLILALATTSAYYALFDAKMELELPFRYFFVIYPVLYAVFQAVVWCVGPAGIPKTITVVALGLMVPNWLFFDFGFSPFDVNQYSWSGVAATLMIAFLASGIAFEQQRKGRFAELFGLQLFRRRARALETGLSGSFASKAEALRWYENHRQSRLFPSLLILLTLGFFLVEAAEGPGLPTDPPPPMKYILAHYAEFVWTSVMVGMLFGTLLASIIFLFRGWRPLFKKEGAFLLVRPATTLELTTARWDATAKSVALGALPLIGLTVATFFVDVRELNGNPQAGEHSTIGHLAQHQSMLLVVLLGAAAAVYLCSVVWASLWLENFFAIGVIAAVVTVFVEATAGLFEMREVTRSAMVYSGTAAISFIALSFLFYSNRRKQLVSGKHLAFAVVFAPVVGIGLLWLKRLIGFQVDSFALEQPFELSELSTSFPIVMAVVIAPFLTGPAITQYARHRR